VRLAEIDILIGVPFSLIGGIALLATALGWMHPQAVIMGGPLFVWGAFFAAGGTNHMRGWPWPAAYAMCFLPIWAMPAASLAYFAIFGA
jgi:hypothetical protein